MATDTRYYVVERNYVGPNRDQPRYVDADTIEIRTSPARTNMSGEARTEGWCGTTNGWSVYAHGEYASLEDARAAIADKFGDVRDSDANGDIFEEPDDDDVVEVYKPGKYAPMGRQATADWAYYGIQSDIDADTTDERIAELVAEYEAAANIDGYTLHRGTLESLMWDRREELRNDRDEDD